MIKWNQCSPLAEGPRPARRVVIPCRRQGLINSCYRYSNRPNKKNRHPVLFFSPCAPLPLWIYRKTMPLNRKPMIGKLRSLLVVLNQILTRYHRIGQDKPVYVKRLVVENTIEERCVFPFWSNVYVISLVMLLLQDVKVGTCCFGFYSLPLYVLAEFRDFQVRGCSWWKFRYQTS